MVWRIEIEGDEAVFEERRGATRGTNYFYIESNGELSPVRLLGQERFVEEFAGNVKKYRVRVDLGRIRGNVVYHFAFSKKAFFFPPRLYRIENGEIREIGSLNREEMRNLKFKILGGERNLAEPFEGMREDIREIMNARGFVLFFSGHARRTQEAVKDPDIAYITSMVFPNSNSRVNVLKKKMSAVHEIWVMIRAIDALDAEVEDVVGKRRLWIKMASETPTAFIRTHHYQLTLWYQFPIEEQFRTVFAGMVRGRRYHVRPDIVIFKGFHRDAGDVRTEEGDRIMQKAVVIDPKIEMRESDVEQLEAYTRLFPEGSKFICPCMYMATLRPTGWDVIEDVRPGGEGVSIFIEKLKEAIREICSSS